MDAEAKASDKVRFLRGSRCYCEVFLHCSRYASRDGVRMASIVTSPHAPQKGRKKQKKNPTSPFLSADTTNGSGGTCSSRGLHVDFVLLRSRFSGSDRQVGALVRGADLFWAFPPIVVGILIRNCHTLGYLRATFPGG